MAHILIIDDESMVRRSVRKLLESQSHRVDEAATGSEGLAQYMERRHDLVITDLRLPDVDGYQLIGDLQTLDGDIKIVVISGDSGERPQQNGATVRYLQKPFTLTQLLDVVGSALS